MKGVKQSKNNNNWSSLCSAFMWQNQTVRVWNRVKISVRANLQICGSQESFNLWSHSFGSQCFQFILYNVAPIACFVCEKAQTAPGRSILILRFRLGLKKKVFDWRKKKERKKRRKMFAPMHITIGTYGSIFNHFQTSNQKSVLKNKWLIYFFKSDLPTLIYFYVTPIKPFLGLRVRTSYGSLHEGNTKYWQDQLVKLDLVLHHRILFLHSLWQELWG